MTYITHNDKKYLNKINQILGSGGFDLLAMLVLRKLLIVHFRLFKIYWVKSGNKSTVITD